MFSLCINLSYCLLCTNWCLIWCKDIKKYMDETFIFQFFYHINVFQTKRNAKKCVNKKLTGLVHLLISVGH